MEALGINFIWIISYIVIFMLLYLVAKRFVAKVLETVETRKNLIEEGIRNAQQAETLKAQALEEAKAEKQKLLQDSYKQAQDIIASAKTKEGAIVEEAQKRAGVVIADAQEELSALKEKSRHEGIADAKEIITVAVKKAFDGLTLDSKTESKLIEESLGNIK